MTAAATLELENVIRRRHVSKHRQFDDKGKWIPGRVRIADNSSLRKLMRAARRGMVPDERVTLIGNSMACASRHPTLHMSAHQKAMHGLRQALAARATLRLS